MRHLPLLFLIGCANAVPAGLNVDTDESTIEGTFAIDHGVVELHASGDAQRGELDLVIDGKALDIRIDLQSRVVSEDAHGNVFDLRDRSVLLALRDTIGAQHPEWMQSLHGGLLAKAADRYAEVPIGRALERHEVSFQPVGQSDPGKGDEVTSGCGGDGVTCLPGTSGTSWAVFSSGGKCLAYQTPYGDSVCRGRCGIGCSFWDSDYTWDCLDHDVCLDYSNDCSDEFSDATDDWAATFGPYCSSGTVRQKPPSVPTPMLIGVQSSKCIDVSNASTANGADVFLWTCHGGGNQQWMAVPQADGSVQLKVAHSGKCLDVRDANPANGAAIQQWDCANTPSQHWVMKKTGDNFALVSQVSQRCLDVAGAATAAGSKLQTWDCHYGGNQMWHR